MEEGMINSTLHMRKQTLRGSKVSLKGHTAIHYQYQNITDLLKEFMLLQISSTYLCSLPAVSHILQ